MSRECAGAAKDAEDRCRHRRGQLKGFGREIMEQRFLEIAERRQAAERAEAAAKARAESVDGDESVH
jgi:hypothetical protein